MFTPLSTENKLNLSKILYYFPRFLALFIILLWLVAITIAYKFNQYFVIGFLISLILLFTTLIAWKSDPLGGIVFIILGFAYLVVAFGKSFSFTTLLGSAPLFTLGLLFISNHLYQEKKYAEEDDIL